MTDPEPRRRAPGPYSPVGTFDPLPEWVGPSTTVLHGARRPERNAGAVVPPVYQTSTFHYPPEHSDADARGKAYFYTRLDNPGHEVVSELVRRLEGAEGARVFASGMGAISTTLLSFLSSGDEVVALSDLYGGTIELLQGVLPRMGVRVRWVSDAQSRAPETLVGPSTRLVMLESPTNPLLRLHDLARWASAAHRGNALVVVDGTFATPINQRALKHGADLVVHSATKYLGGHADLLGGVVAGRAELLETIDRTHSVLGSVLDPFAAFLLIRGLRTLPLRVRQQNENGRRVADALAQHPKVRRVYYPGRGEPEQEAIAVRQMSGRGGMVSIVVDGGKPALERFLGQLRFVHVAGSLGGVESLVSVPSETSHRQLTSEQRAARGMEDGLVRLSLGIEEPEDLIRDLTEALDAC